MHANPPLRGKEIMKLNNSQRIFRESNLTLTIRYLCEVIYIFTVRVLDHSIFSYGINFCPEYFLIMYNKLIVHAI